MYENNYPNDYNNENKNAADGTVREVSAENGNFSGQNMNSYHTGTSAGTYISADNGRNNSRGYENAGNSYGSGNNYGTNNYGRNSSAYNGSAYSSVYSTGTGYQSPKYKKEKKTGNGSTYWKKFLAAVSLGLFFGSCAGAGFYAVESATGMLTEKEVIKETAAEVMTEKEVAAGEVTKGTADNTIQSGGTSGAVALDVSDVAAKVMPSIVSINNTNTQTASYFGQTFQSESVFAGSGIIVGESDTELIMVSNYHVVENADKLVVQFADGSETEAQMKGSDPDMDLAVIAVPLDNIDKSTKDAVAVATMGDSDSLLVGEAAIAIGNALGYGQSVTVGVISATDRVIDLSNVNGAPANSENGATFIQTDAAINPGNSGGALLNIKGEVIGINSNKIGGSVVEGMGYAIPISAAKPIIEDLMLKETRTKVTEDNKGYLGITPLTVVKEMAETYGMPKGVYVSQVYEGTAAEKAGIVKGNIITEFDGNKIAGSEDLFRVMEYYSAGDTVEITLMQGSPSGWESKTVTVTLGGKFE